MNCVFTQEQHDAAVEWLEKHREELGLAKERNAERRADARRLHEETDGFGYFPGSERRMKKFSDVSDSEDDADVDDLDESELDRERRRVNDEFKEKLEKIVKIVIASKNGDHMDETMRAQKERFLESIRMIRQDPLIAPDEPTYFYLRPFDVSPGDTSRDHKYVYKYALTTVQDVCRSMAKKLKVPAEQVDIIKGGKRMERERTLMDHGVGFGFVLYLKVEEGEHYVDLTGVVAEGDGGTRVRVSRVRRSEDGGWVVVGAVEDDDGTDGTDDRR